MGSGEPLANYKRVIEAVRRICDPAPDGLGISQRTVTVSTVGLVPAIRKLTEENMQVRLAVSLHTPDDELRDTLVPVNTRWKVSEVLEAARGYADKTGRRVSIEYALIKEINDQPWRADLLGKILRKHLGQFVHVNLIPLNPTPGSKWDASPKPVEREFVRRVRPAASWPLRADIRWRRRDGPACVCPMAELKGMCEERFADVRDALAASLDEVDVGASVAVFVGGELVVDLWGGYVDAGRTVLWERDTITNVWSTTKTMVALCALILADRGQLDLDAPVATYWPEFAATGVRVRHVLSHTAGLPTWEAPVTVADLCDSPKVTALLAQQSPLWEPGTVGCYHPVTQGFLMGEVVRRITGRSLGTFFAEEIAGPLNADFHIGLPVEHDHRLAPIIPPPNEMKPPPSNEMFDTTPNPYVHPEDGNSLGFRRSELPSAAGFGNARSVATVQSVLARGGLGLLSEAGCERALEQQYTGMDYHLGASMSYGMGYGVSGRNCFWGGMGGSLVFVDFDAAMTVAYVMNQMIYDGPTGDDRGMSMVTAAYSGLAG